HYVVREFHHAFVCKILLLPRRFSARSLAGTGSPSCPFVTFVVTVLTLTFSASPRLCGVLLVLVADWLRCVLRGEVLAATAKPTHCLPDSLLQGNALLQAQLCACAFCAWNIPGRQRAGR